MNTTPFAPFAVMWIMVLLGLLFGGVALLAWLLRNPATRWVGALLIVFGSFLAVLVASVFFWRLSAHDAQVAAQVDYARRDYAARIKLLESKAKEDYAPSIVVTDGGPSVSKAKENQAPSIVVTDSQSTAASVPASDKPSETPPAAKVAKKKSQKSEKNEQKKPADSALPRDLGADDASPKAELEPAKAAPSRPAWIDDKPHDEPDGYQLIVSVGPYSTEVECQRELPAKLRQALDDYLEVHSPAGMRPRVTASADLLLSKQFNVVREIHRETVQSSFGPMQMIHVRLVFGDTVKRWCEELARERLLYRRLAVAGVLLGMVLCAMSVAWGYLKLGPTAGFASRFLAATAGAAMLATAAVGGIWIMRQW